MFFFIIKYKINNKKIVDLKCLHLICHMNKLIKKYHNFKQKRIKSIPIHNIYI